MANRTPDDIIESLLAEEGVPRPAPEPEADGDPFEAAAADLLTAIQHRDRRAFAEALRAVLDLHRGDGAAPIDLDDLSEPVGALLLRNGSR